MDEVDREHDLRNDHTSLTPGGQGDITAYRSSLLRIDALSVRR